jgi:hypothetical protein
MYSGPPINLPSGSTIDVYNLVWLTYGLDIFGIIVVVINYSLIFVLSQKMLLNFMCYLLLTIIPIYLVTFLIPTFI